MAPWLMIFKDDLNPEDAMYNNFRVFGTGLLCIMGIAAQSLEHSS